MDYPCAKFGDRIVLSAILVYRSRVVILIFYQFFCGIGFAEHSHEASVVHGSHIRTGGRTMITIHRVSKMEHFCFC